MFKYSKKFAEKKEVEEIGVSIVGYPNTGKSSVVNILKNRHICNTGSTAFITKNIQTVKLNRQVTLFDTPAVVQTNAGDNIRSAIQVDDIIDPIAAVTQLLEKVEKSEFLRHYRIGSFKTAEDLVELVAKKKGMVEQIKTPDEKKKGKKQEKAKLSTTADKVQGARRVLRDFLNNRLQYFSKIPGANAKMASDSDEESD